jgi:hypothetical protein
MGRATWNDPILRDVRVWKPEGTSTRRDRGMRARATNSTAPKRYWLDLRTVRNGHNQCASESILSSTKPSLAWEVAAAGGRFPHGSEIALRCRFEHSGRDQKVPDASCCLFGKNRPRMEVVTESPSLWHCLRIHDG